MTQEEKDLLLKDLCARLPYNVQVKTEYDDCISFTWNELKYFTHENKICKPYLRPMSSMTEEDIQSLFNAMYPNLRMMWYEKETDLIRFRAADYNNKRFLHITLWFNKVYSLEQIDWFNAHHFDYRGLIEKSLAIVALENMYK